MARLDRKIGRFSVDYETNEIMAGIRGWVEGFGDFFDYYRFDRQDSVSDDVYDEGTGIGKRYLLTPMVPAIHVVHREGGTEDVDTGWYYNDDLHITASYDMLAKIGLKKMDLDTGSYLKDRIQYDGKIFRVTSISVLGQVQRRDIIVTFDATQVKPDELVDDAQFVRWSTFPPPEILGGPSPSPVPFIDGGTP